ncbi:LysR family transcriptional regulator [Celeribacter neptunius]|uniref:ModE molybdate transport repressor domain-containing protein n=1 Tax=Celeribacter neptunius TaxID=588602 RepID=A0A1I3TE51_9RHOB|nr:LysR family transcriptional regulator [Celeribacter neptunius]SFJ68719.1 ModE molybdate transport repressor domain-containing protein [Celeribacter neptunius]
MDLATIELIQELARSGSIRQTAELSGMSPTAVTRQLDKLEHAFGTPLVERTPRGVRLTAAGEVVVARSHNVARELSMTRQMIDELKGLRRGHVSVHVNGAAISSILAPAISEFSGLHPQISIEVVVSSAQAALDAVATGQTDLAVTMFAPVDARVVIRFRMPVRHEPILSPEHPLAAREELSISDLVGCRLALPNRSFGVRRQFDARLRAQGYEPSEAAFTTSSLELQKDLARRGSAVLILPQMTVQREIDNGDLVMRPFTPQSRIETLLDLSHSLTRHQSFAARQLLEFLERFLDRHHG